MGLLLTGCLASSGGRPSRLSDVEAGHAGGPLAGETELAVHGTVVFGEKGQFMYHLPMWWTPHDWHLVLEVALDRAGQALYRNERVAGSPLVTFSPQMFPLAALAPGFEVMGELFRGHFEVGGQRLPQPEHALVVTAAVKRIVALKRLDPDAPEGGGAVYRVFGAGDEWYATHVPARSPDYDQVVRLEPVQGLVSEEDLGAGFDFTSTAPPMPASGGGLHVGDSIEGSLPSGRSASLRVTNVEYFSVRDLGR